jgi:hypothetical protein
MSKMPRPDRNTLPMTNFRDGFTLKSGKKLSVEDAYLIGEEAGLLTRRKADHKDSSTTEWILCPVTGDRVLIQTNPIYIPYIDNNEPTPPMLQFISSCNGSICKSSYTINLNTLKPTANSPIKKEIPEYIRAKYI